MEKIFTVLGPQSLVQCVPGGHPVPEEGNGAPMALLTMLQSCLHWTPLVYDIHSPGQSLATQALACQFKLLFWFLVNIATSRVTQAIIYKQETIILISQYSPLILLCHPFTISYYYRSMIMANSNSLIAILSLLISQSLHLSMPWMQSHRILQLHHRLNSGQMCFYHNIQPSPVSRGRTLPC